MGFRLDFDIDTNGPVFDGSWEYIVSSYRLDLEEELGENAEYRIKRYLPTQYMYLGNSGGDPKDNPPPADAGYLVAHIQWHREIYDAVYVTDGGYPAMIYGPWIEGIGPGNLYFGAKGRRARGLSPRFSGYHAFAKISKELQLEVVIIAERMLPPYLAALNGDLYHPADPLVRVHGGPGCPWCRLGPGGESGTLPGGRKLGRCSGRLSDGLAVLRRRCNVR